MTENTSTNKINSFQKQKNKDEMKKQVITFVLMIAFTIVAFAIVGTGIMQKMFVIPLLLILALVQVGFQFYYFMHLKDKGHEMPATMIYGGMWAALLTIVTLSVIAWW
ncbi:cytochrome c oxidase subunit IVB [Virgibacillus profundi]|uniref:Cytochrome c oxidase subunit IVB n=1 Tax=Virgibacillus profundi TaxID=2024555 RepID=A0A2A2IFH6_9BACI|nr:cytochrome c oxidase subunit IVB [Virgibacillus profundi]PAV29885.1 cytochrome c oxidase subunit IVB [Virgibacillus profundi]PXY54057.1 cytochrome c oxidase subunit IVB [Virgibacillus profundi]